MTAIVLDRLFGGDRPRLLIVEGEAYLLFTCNINVSQFC